MGPPLRPQHDCLLSIHGTRSPRVALPLSGGKDISYVSIAPLQKAPTQGLRCYFVVFRGGKGRGPGFVEIERRLLRCASCSFRTPSVAVGQIFFPRDEFTVLSVISWILLPRVNSEAIAMRMREPAEDMSGVRPAGPHPVLGLLGRRMVLKLHRRRHMASEAILTRSCCCEGYGPSPDEDLRIPHLFHLVCSIRPIFRERVVLGGLASPSFQTSNLIRQSRSIGA